MAMEPPLLLLMLFIASIICVVGANPIEEIAGFVRRGTNLPLKSAKNLLKKGVPARTIVKKGVPARTMAPFERLKAIEEQEKVVEYWERMEWAAKLNGKLAGNQAPPPPPPPPL